MPGDIEAKIDAINSGQPVQLPRPAGSTVNVAHDAQTVDQMINSMAKKF